MIKRQLTKKLKEIAGKFPAVTLIGPRQSGKTTLVKAAFPDKQYVSLEDPDIREFARTDPKGFLSGYKGGAIFDEIQRVPDILSYLQSIIDDSDKSGQFILTGSQNILVSEKFSQTLAGRTAVLKLLPFSYSELKASLKAENKYEKFLFKGLYPRIYDKKVSPQDWYPSYIQTYVERDLRMIKNITDLNSFRLFLKMCASRTGQILNLTSLANDCGITHNTAKSWISVLETSFIIFLLNPYYRNYNKRLKKAPKLYFYDPGIVSSLLGIENEKQLETFHLKGNLFETFIISEIVKERFNGGRETNCFYWQDKTGHEIDCLVEKGGKLMPVEIKSGRTPSIDYFKYIKYFNNLSGVSSSDAYVIYGGNASQKRSQGNLLSWKDMSSFLKEV